MERLGIEQGFAKPQLGTVEADPIIAATTPGEAEHVADTLAVRRGAAGAAKARGNGGGVIRRSHLFFPHGFYLLEP